MFLNYKATQYLLPHPCTAVRYKPPSFSGTCRRSDAEIQLPDPPTHPLTQGPYHAILMIVSAPYPFVSKTSQLLDTSHYQETFLWNSLCCPYFCNAGTYSQVHCAPVGSTVHLSFKCHFSPPLGYFTAVTQVVRAVQRVLPQQQQSSAALLKCCCFQLIS